ncbi:MAG: YicC/YloC family endoribonuclease [Pseudomonadota bacterium]
MISSMTGYAASSIELSGLNLALDVRSVNSRYLEIQFRMNEELRALEPLLRERIAQQVQRGKLECRVTLNSAAVAPTQQLNVSLLERLASLGEQVRAHLPEVAPMNLADVLRWPGMLDDSSRQQDLAQPCLALLDTVLREFKASRQREGDKLKQHLLQRVTAMEAQIARVAPRLPELVRAYQAKLVARFTEVLGSADDERIRQEIALFAQKIDVDEELTRLATHLKEMRRILDDNGAAGKRLDFLMQELNREANTLGSKSVSVETTQVAMELKVLIEQMREQIQNLE